MSGLRVPVYTELFMMPPPASTTIVIGGLHMVRGMCEVAAVRGFYNHIYTFYLYVVETLTPLSTHTGAQPINDNGWSGGRWHGIYLDMVWLG